VAKMMKQPARTVVGQGRASTKGRNLAARARPRTHADDAADGLKHCFGLRAVSYARIPQTNPQNHGSVPCRFHVQGFHSGAELGSTRVGRSRQGGGIAQAKKVDPRSASARACRPDMLRSPGRGQVATFWPERHARAGRWSTARFEDNETTVDQLKARLARRWPSQDPRHPKIDAADDREITFPLARGKRAR